ncbi:MAG: ATP-grasp domain-containing protein [Hyphomicrobium sp.]|nr:ATP-grasp domain-containing protein [Hyphomicrobium sp.]
MTSTILIAAFSGRSLAQSARRAGYVPLVADAFGDQDTRAAAHDFRSLDGAMQTGFRAKPLLAALNELIAAAPSKPIGLVLGSGFEDKPRLVDLLDQRYGVIGCGVEALTACKDPKIFFPVLDELGIAHPETRMTPPDNCEGWITKRIGGSGGRHIRDCTATSRAKPRRYFQKRIEGTRISVSAIVADGIATDMTRQWCSPAPGQPYQYGGAVSVPYSDTPDQLQMLMAVDQLARGLELRGLVSFDFIVANGTAYLLEINPRPGASLDVIDTVEGSRFHAHVAACRDGKLDQWGGSSTGLAKAAAILHAGRGALTLGPTNWPEWTADRGAPGTHVPAGAPLATVFGEAETPDAAVALARARLAELESLIYESTKS